MKIDLSADEIEILIQWGECLEDQTMIDLDLLNKLIDELESCDD
jgi:hypothetical protein